VSGEVAQISCYRHLGIRRLDSQVPDFGPQGRGSVRCAHLRRLRPINIRVPQIYVSDFRRISVRRVDKMKIKRKLRRVDSIAPARFSVRGTHEFSLP